MFLSVGVVFLAASLAQAQRPFFAGSRPIGYPEMESSTGDSLADRFGEVDTTTIRLPLEAQGDKALVDRLSKLPIDKQPFWFINWQALEANRKNPQTYPLRPNGFAEPLNTNAVQTNHPGAGTLDAIPNMPSMTSSSSNFENRFGTPTEGTTQREPSENLQPPHPKHANYFTGYGK